MGVAGKRTPREVLRADASGRAQLVKEKRNWQKVQTAVNQCWRGGLNPWSGASVQYMFSGGSAIDQR